MIKPYNRFLIGFCLDRTYEELKLVQMIQITENWLQVWIVPMRN